MAANKVLNNCFGPIAKEDRAPALDPVVYDKTKKEYVLVPYSEQVDGDPEHLVVLYKPVLKSEVDIQEYVQSFADDVGIQNILKKLSISGDRSILNQTGREPMLENGGLEPIQDYTDAPRSKTEAFNSVVAGINAFDQLPEDLKGKMSLTQFAQLFGQEEFDNYIKNIVAGLNAAGGEDKHE